MDHRGRDRGVHAADRPIPADRAADHHRQRYLPWRQRRNRREDSRHADRRTDQRRGEYALHVQPVDQHREPEPDGDVQGRHESRRGPGAGAGAEPGGYRAAAAPPEVQLQGITVKKASPDITLAIAFFSPDGSHDALFISSYVTLQLKDEIARLPGVATSRSLACATIRCGCGSIPTSSRREA